MVGPWYDFSEIGATTVKSSLAGLSTASTDAYSFSTTTTGTIVLRYCVDTTNSVSEGLAGESNNCVMSSITINPPAACTPQTVFYCSLPSAGDSVSVTGSCSNGYGGACSYTCHNGAFDTEVTNTCAPATINLFEVCDSDRTSNCVVGGGTKTTIVGTPLSFYWQTENADFCQAIAGLGFTIGVSPGPMWVDITANTSPATDAYTISCGNDGVASVLQTVSIETVGETPVLTANNIYVKEGTNTVLSWDTRDPDFSSCVITGPNFSQTPDAVTGNLTTPPLVGQSVFTLTCGSSIDSITVRMMPSGFES